jgi:hypothetical protein
MRGPERARALLLLPLVLPLVLGAASARAQDVGEPPPDNEHYQLLAELGVEYDSNAHRVEEVAGRAGAIVGSFLQRLVLSAQLADQIAPRQTIAWSATAAGKLFDAPAARSENVAIAQSSLMWRTALGARTWLSPSGVYYEAFQSWAPEGDPAGERRDFRSLAPALELRTGLSNSIELGVAAGYRWLLFKPDRDFDFNGPTAGINLRWLFDTESGADWEARAGGAIEYRSFAGPAYIGNCSPDSLPCPGTAVRTDDFLVAQADLTRTGRILLGAGYVFGHNASNSFGQTLFRHVVGARIATALPFGLYVAARADLSLVFYRDSIPIPRTADMTQMVAGKPFVNIEDENRSSVRVDLSRDVSERLRVLLRYTFYANELGSSAGTYRRQTLLLSLAFAVEK